MTLQEAISSFQIAENYFSDILNSQIIIFSLILAAIISFYFVFNWRISKNQIRKKIREAMKEVKSELSKELEEKSKKINEKLAKDIKKHEEDITILRGEIYRTLGQYWKSQKQHSSAFIWWIRAAEQFALARDEKMVRISLNSAKESVERVQYATQLNYDLIGEYQNIFSKISSETYRIEKDLLEKATRNALEKQSTVLT